MRNQVGSGSALMQGIARKITKNRISRTGNPESVSSFSDGIASGTCRARASPTFAWEKSRQPEAQVSGKTDMAAVRHHLHTCLLCIRTTGTDGVRTEEGERRTRGSGDAAGGQGRGPCLQPRADTARGQCACNPPNEKKERELSSVRPNEKKTGRRLTTAACQIL